MNDVPVSIPAEQYERLEALAAARGLSPDVLVARLIEDAYQGHDPDAPDSIDLPLGVCDGEESGDEVGNDVVE